MNKRSSLPYDKNPIDACLAAQGTKKIITDENIQLVQYHPQSFPLRNFRLIKCGPDQNWTALHFLPPFYHSGSKEDIYFPMDQVPLNKWIIHRRTL